MFLDGGAIIVMIPITLISSLLRMSHSSASSSWENVDRKAKLMSQPPTPQILPPNISHYKSLSLILTIALGHLGVCIRAWRAK